MISKRFLQLLDKKSNTQMYKDSWFPVMNRLNETKECLPVKVTAHNLRPSIMERWRGLSANEADQYPTDISFDGKPSTGCVFRRRIKQNEEGRKTKRLFVMERKTMTPETGAFSSNHTKSTHLDTNSTVAGMLSSKQARSLLNKRAHLRANLKHDVLANQAMIPSLTKRTTSQQNKDVLGCPSKLIGISRQNFSHKKNLAGIVGPSLGRLISDSSFNVRTANAFQARSSPFLREDFYASGTKRLNNFI